MAEETILLNVKIDQSDAQKQLVQTEKNLLNLKKQQAELTKEYKAGKITQDQYVESNLKLQKAIKNETDQKRTLSRVIDTESNSRNALKLRVSELTKEYDNLNKSTAAGAKRADELQKELSQLNAEINQSSKSAGLFKDQIGNYPDAFAQATNEIKPFGVSVDGATASIAKFATPATAIVGIIAGIGTAYLKSSAGAKDFAFAQDRLRFITDSLVEGLGQLISGTGEGGQGILNTIIDRLIDFRGIVPGLGLVFNDFFENLKKESRAAAQAAEDLRKLEIQAIRAQGFAKLFEKTAEEARRLRDDESQALETRLAQTSTIEQNLTANQKVRVNTLEQEIEAIKRANVNWQNQDEIVLAIEGKQANIRDIQEEITGKLTENVAARRNILKLIEEERNLTNADNRAQRRALETSDITPESVREEAEARIGRFSEDFAASQIDINKALNDRLLKANEDFYKRDLAAKKKSAELKQQVDEAQVFATQAVLGAIGSLFDRQSDEYKALASAQVLISTYSAATKAYEAAFLPLPTVASPALGAAFAAAAIAQGLANLANINGIQFAEGGWTGPGSKYQPAGVVHADEYVIPKHIVNSPAAQPHIAAVETMRTRGYADGGFVTNQNISPFQMAMITANAIKNMPAPVVSWREGQKVGQRVEWREQTSQR